jgi:hypothetical protein
MEKGWMAILGGLGLLVILLAAIPLRWSQSTLSLSVATFFAVLPLVITLCVVVSKHWPSSKKVETMATLYYRNKTQQKIAAAIEQSDTALLRTLIKGQKLDVKGNSLWNQEGLNYLQFAIRLRSGSDFFPLNDSANLAAIRLLVEQGSPTTPALAEAIKTLSPEMIVLLLDAGADPNTHGYVDNDPLLFEVMGISKQKNDMAILLLQRGADVNAKALNNYGMTPVMSAANNARTSAKWNDAWRMVRYLLEEAHGDYAYATKDGFTLQGIIRKIRTDAAAEKVTMPPDFMAVVKWLKEHGIDTEPEKQNN